MNMMDYSDSEQDTSSMLGHERHKETERVKASNLGLPTEPVSGHSDCGPVVLLTPTQLVGGG